MDLAGPLKAFRVAAALSGGQSQSSLYISSSLCAIQNIASVLTELMRGKLTGDRAPRISTAEFRTRDHGFPREAKSWPIDPAQRDSFHNSSE